MAVYSLLPDEVKLYEGRVDTEGYSRSVQFLLTNKNLVLMPEIEPPKKKMFSKKQPLPPEPVPIIFPVTDVKVYQGQPQIHRKGENVTLSLIPQELTLTFESSMEATNFTLAAMKLLTGKSVAERSIDRIANAIGPDASNVVKGVIENGIGGTLLNGIGGRRNKR